MSFWGTEIKPDKSVPWVPPPDVGRLHLSQATLDWAAKDGDRSAVTCKVGEDEVLICSLRGGSLESVAMDLVFDHYTEFTVKGPHSVHLAGYLMPDIEDMEDDSEDEDEEDGELDEEILNQIALQRYGRPLRELLALPDFDPAMLGIEMDEDSSEEDDEEEDSEEESGDEEPLPQGRANHSVVIEDVTEHPDGKETKVTTHKTVTVEAPLQGAAQPVADGKLEDGAAKQLKAVADAAVAAIEDEDEEESSSDEEDDDNEEGGLLGMDIEAGPEEGSEEESDEEEESEEEEDEGDIHDAILEQMKQEAAAQQAQQQAKAGEKKADKAAGGKGKEQGKNKRKEEPPASAEPPSKKAAKGTPNPATKTPNGVAQAKEKAVPKTAPAKLAATAPGKGKDRVRRFDNGFEIHDLAQGEPTAKLAKPGKEVTVKYVGRLQKTGKVFDRTKGDKTFKFRLGTGQVIKGWDSGVKDMRVGDKRKLVIPPQMGYAAEGVKGVIPPNATLVFDVELVDVK